MNRFSLLLLSGIVGATSASAQVSLAPLNTWGGGDGWLAPGEGGYTFLGTGNNERGLAYGNGHVYLVSRNGGSFIRVLDQNTGADLSTPLNTTGVSGGTFAVNCISVGADGAIYVGNLTTQSTTSPFKVYKWATEASASVVAYTGDAGLAGSRVGDSLTAIGGGSSTRLAAGFGSTPAVAGNNSYTIVNPTASSAAAVTLATPPNAGDFRLGITFTDATHVLGTQGSSLYRYTSFSGTSGTLLGSPVIPDPAGASSDRLLAYSVINGLPILAVQSIGDSHVSIYDVSNPGAPVWLASGNNTSGSLTANSNGSGQLAWGASTSLGDGRTSQVLYAMSSNQGIEAFVVTIPEPGTMSILLLGAGLLCCRRKASA